MPGWYLFIRKDDGELASVATASPPHLLPCRENDDAGQPLTPDPACDYHVRHLADPPNWAVRMWDRLSRQLVDRPIPVLIDRLDDIEARFQAGFGLIVMQGMRCTDKDSVQFSAVRIDQDVPVGLVGRW